MESLIDRLQKQIEVVYSSDSTGFRRQNTRELRKTLQKVSQDKNFSENLRSIAHNVHKGLGSVWTRWENIEQTRKNASTLCSLIKQVKAVNQLFEPDMLKIIPTLQQLTNPRNQDDKVQKFNELNIDEYISILKKAGKGSGNTPDSLYKVLKNLKDFLPQEEKDKIEEYISCLESSGLVKAENEVLVTFTKLVPLSSAFKMEIENKQHNDNQIVELKPQVEKFVNLIKGKTYDEILSTLNNFGGTNIDLAFKKQVETVFLKLFGNLKEVVGKDLVFKDSINKDLCENLRLIANIFPEETRSQLLEDLKIISSLQERGVKATRPNSLQRPVLPLKKSNRPEYSCIRKGKLNGQKIVCGNTLSKKPQSEILMRLGGASEVMGGLAPQQSSVSM